MFGVEQKFGHPPPRKKVGDFPRNYVLGTCDRLHPGTAQAVTGPIEA
jgi:hypothetical protein